MLNSAEHEVCPANKSQSIINCNFCLRNITEHKNISANIYEKKSQLLLAFSYLLAEKISCSVELSMKKFITPGPGQMVSSLAIYLWLHGLPVLWDAKGKTKDFQRFYWCIIVKQKGVFMTWVNMQC